MPPFNLFGWIETLCAMKSGERKQLQGVAPEFCQFLINELSSLSNGDRQIVPDRKPLVQERQIVPTRKPWYIIKASTFPGVTIVTIPSHGGDVIATLKTAFENILFEKGILFIKTKDT